LFIHNTFDTNAEGFIRIRTACVLCPTDGDDGDADFYFLESPSARNKYFYSKTVIFITGVAAHFSTRRFASFRGSHR